MLSSADASKVGQQVGIRLGDDDKITHTLVTESSAPAVFTVEEFLTDEESDALMKIMRKQISEGNLGESKTVNDGEDGRWAPDEWTPWSNSDRNRDGKATVAEIHQAMQQDWDAGGFTIEDLLKLVPEMGAGKDPWIRQRDGQQLPQQEWWMERHTYDKMTWKLQQKARHWLRVTYPEKHSRNSMQMWLGKHEHNPTPEFHEGYAREFPKLGQLLSKVDARVSKLLRVPRDVLKYTEDLQMVSYNSTPPGHYRGHHDSSLLEDGLRPFRIYTVFFILNEAKYTPVTLA